MHPLLLVANAANTAAFEQHRKLDMVRLESKLQPLTIK